MSIQISDSELSIMKVLWEKSPLTSSEIQKRMRGNKAVMRTLLQRLLAKEAIEAKPIDKRSYLYYPKVKKEDYEAQTSRHFLEKVFDGSSRAMMMNFIKGEQVTVSELEELLDMLKEES